MIVCNMSMHLIRNIPIACCLYYGLLYKAHAITSRPHFDKAKIKQLHVYLWTLVHTGNVYLLIVHVLECMISETIWMHTCLYRRKSILITYDDLSHILRCRSCVLILLTLVTFQSYYLYVFFSKEHCFWNFDDPFLFPASNLFNKKCQQIQLVHVSNLFFQACKTT